MARSRLLYDIARWENEGGAVIPPTDAWADEPLRVPARDGRSEMRADAHQRVIGRFDRDLGCLVAQERLSR